jgi:glutaminyl-tRNA synthetase
MNEMQEKPANFIEGIITDDFRAAGSAARLHTRFPPEPNGYLHIGHAKAICLNHGLAVKFGGRFNLRFDDTNPVKEEAEYVRSIIEDVRWLGAKWEGMKARPTGATSEGKTPLPHGRGSADAEAGVIFASDYFQQMYDYAVELVKKGRAFVCDLSAEATARNRGTLTSPGADSPHRDRGVDENLDLLERMRNGEFPNGARTLRAKIDMASPNLNLRDPVMYRILHAPHHRTGDAWCIYPMYDWAHGIEDSIEGITHSICTLEFENHRPLYDWFLDAINEGRTDDGGGPWGKKIPHPRQIEFARLELTHTVMSKRKLLELVKGGHVRGWDDPRLPTLSAYRRRGYTPESIRDFCADVGVAKFNSTIDLVRLENAVRHCLNKTAPRVLAVLRPLRVIITNYPQGQVEQLDAVNNPEDPAAGTRRVPFSRELFIERDDYLEDPPKKFFRLGPGREVRLRYAYFVTCQEAVKNDAGQIVELRCTYDPATRGGDAPDGRKVKGTLHWVSAAHAVDAEVRLYDRLFTDLDPDSPRHDRDYKEFLNRESLEVIAAAKIEPSVATAAIGARFQFERHGYFCVDPDSDPAAGAAAASASPSDPEAPAPGRTNATALNALTPGRSRRKLVFNRTVSLKDTWAKIAGKG